MSYIIIEQTKVRKLKLPSAFSLDKIQIGVPVCFDEANKVNLKTPGDIILPSSSFGSTCKRNAYGYTYVDNTQPKEKRYITTNWIQPYGNPNASHVACDVYRMCYPQIDVSPTEIEFIFFQDENEKQYVIANLTLKIREKYLVEAVNLFLEIYGKCYIFSDEINISDTNKRRRCNWEILPPGEKPSIHLIKQLRQSGEDTDTFEVERLRLLDQYRVEQVVEGINGFKGYFAYVFSNHCILESAIYGNATYIIPKENWEILSQKTKRDLFDENAVIDKVIHSKYWKGSIRRIIKNLENQ